MKSLIVEGGRATFPEHTGERVYMEPFRKASGLPTRLKRWQPTVDAMLSGVETDGLIYLMVDQSEVVPGQTTRRPGAHVDMIWSGARHGHDGGGGHTKLALDSRWDNGGDQWGAKGFQGIILASDRVGCAVHLGEFDGTIIGNGGEILPPILDRMTLQAGRAYAGDSMQMIHESLPLMDGGKRTVVRLNVNEWMPFNRRTDHD